MTDEFKPIRMPVTNGPDLHFDGQVIGEYTTQNKAGTKDRWTELRLWETPTGNWIAEMVGCSSRDREGTLRTARAIYKPSTLDRTGQIREVMQLFEWTPAAKAFAKQLGWDVIERIQ